MFQSILSNLAILLLGHLLMSTLVNYRDRISSKLFYLFVILLFSSVIITMFYLPIQIGEYRFDMRLIPLIFLAYFRGWKITIPILIITCTWRLIMGGDGAIPGVVFGTVLPTIFILVINKSNFLHTNHVMKMLVITACWAISDVPIIFFFPNGLEIFEEIFLLRYGSFLVMSIIYYGFVKIEHKREELKNELKFLAWHDPLTRLLNRTKFVEVVEEKRGKTTQPTFVAMIDMDHFKKLNDTYGHLVGDEILIKISSILKKYESEHIVIARFGGEEFILYIEAESIDEVVHILEVIRKEISDTVFYSEHKSIILKVTISIGLTLLDSNHTLLECMDLADKNLYKAKDNGRNSLFFDNNLAKIEKAVQG